MIVSMKEAMKPILNNQIEQTKELCNKHDCYKVKIKKTGSIICLKCGQEERQEFANKRGQEKYERNEEKKRLYYLNDFSLVDSELKQATFDNFKADNLNKKHDLERVKKEARNYLKGFDNNVVLIGDVGTGKSHLAFSAIKAISDYTKELATIINVVDLLAKVKQDFSLEAYYTGLLSGNDKNDKIKFLVLDDLGTEKQSEWSANLIYSVLNKRNNTIITTNLTEDELKKRYGKRIYSRIFKGVGQEHVYYFKNKNDERIKTKWH